MHTTVDILPSTPRNSTGASGSSTPNANSGNPARNESVAGLRTSALKLMYLRLPVSSESPRVQAIMFIDTEKAAE